MSDVVHIDLPRPSALGWGAMAVAGLGLLAAGASAVYGDFWGAPLRAYLFAGGGLALANVALLVLLNRQHAVALVVAERGVTVVDNAGGRVRIPLSVLDRATCYDAQNGGYAIALFKKDGGVLEVAALPQEAEAQKTMAPLDRALREAETAGRAVPSEPTDASQLPDVRIERAPGQLQVAWCASWPARLALPLLAAFAGLALIGFGFTRHGGGVGAALFTGFALCLLLLVATTWLWNNAHTERLRLSRENLVCERVRWSRTVNTTSVPVADIAAVDYAHQLNHLGAMLSIRRRSSVQRTRALLGEAPAPVPESVAVAATSLMAALADGLQLPLGKLPLAQKIALDLFLSAEIAARSGRESSDL